MEDAIKPVKIEKIDIDALNKLLRHPGIVSSVKRTLRNMNKSKVNGNCLHVYYDYSKDFQKAKIGRMWANTGLQTLERDVRNLLSQKFYWDADIKNAAFTILLGVCQQNGWTCEISTEYVRNRDAILGDLVEHYGVSKDAVKQLLISVLFLGSEECWQREQSIKIACHEFVSRLTKECKVIAENMWSAEKYKDIVRNIEKKRKETNKKGSLLSTVIFDEEHKILMEFDRCCTLNDRKVGTLLFDGCFIEKRVNETTPPIDLLRICENYVLDKLGYQLEYVFKPIESTIELAEKQTQTNAVDPDIVIDDGYACRVFVELMGDRLVYTQGRVFVFDETTGMWTDSKPIIKNWTVKFRHELTFYQYNDTTGKPKITNYSGCATAVDKMLQFVPPEYHEEDFFQKYIHTSFEKFLFEDGIYDARTQTFTRGFNPKIVFVNRIDRPFQPHRDEELIKKVDKILFKDPFLEEHFKGANYFAKSLARGLCGIIGKDFFMCLGDTNSSKGTLVCALKYAYGGSKGYIGSFNGNHLLFNNNSCDSAKALSWVIPLVYKRVCFSSEMDKDRKASSNLMKSLTSGGDDMVARQNNKDEIYVVNYSMLVSCANDMTEFAPHDSAAEERMKVLEMLKTFKMNPTPGNRLEMQADSNIKNHFEHSVEYKDAIFHLMSDYYQEYLKGCEVPACVIKARNEWAGETLNIKSVINDDDEYEITGCPDDRVPVSSMKFYIQELSKRLQKSPKKLTLELQKVGVEKKVAKILSTNTAAVCWVGIKKRDMLDMRDEDLLD